MGARTGHLNFPMGTAVAELENRNLVVCKFKFVKCDGTDEGCLSMEPNLPPESRRLYYHDDRGIISVAEHYYHRTCYFFGPSHVLFENGLIGYFCPTPDNQMVCCLKKIPVTDSSICQESHKDLFYFGNFLAWQRFFALHEIMNLINV
jgi:hypothetical protein